LLEAKNTINAVRSERDQKVKERKRKHAEEMAEALASKDDEWSKALAAQKIEADKIRVAALKTLAKIICKRQL
jgi:ribonucleotide reductase beta subunit family protein with ferritin-like domain